VDYTLKGLLSILLIFMIPFDAIAVTASQAQQIYNKILRVNNITRAPSLKIVDFILVGQDKDYDNAATGHPWRYIFITKYKYHLVKPK
jgi:hypothetical protein